MKTCYTRHTDWNTTAKVKELEENNMPGRQAGFFTCYCFISDFSHGFNFHVSFFENIFISTLSKVIKAIESF